ncbi:MAG: hypothetical protein JSU09_16515 [Bacteroidetes bacterium]|nr:hypothetical protein [Bacteroidota bacterium]
MPSGRRDKIHEIQKNLESNQNYIFTFLLHAQDPSLHSGLKRNERCHSTASRLAAAHARVGRSVRARPRAQVSFYE